MTKLLLGFVFCAITIIGSRSITDKEYALLPPVFEISNYERCLLLGEEALYCFVEYHVKPIDPHNSSKTWKDIQELSSDRKNYRHDNLRHGICIPLDCPNIVTSPKDQDFKDDLANCYNKKYEHLGIYGTIGDIYCETNEPRKFDLYEITVLIFLIAYALLIIYASFYEGLARYETPEEYERITSTRYGQILSCFSIPKNWTRLRTIEPTPESERFKCLQGLRFYNMFIVILAHTVMLGISGPLLNTKIPEETFDHPMTIFIASGPFCVSTFFQLSAMLLTYNILKRYHGNSQQIFDLKTASWIFLVRYIRLTTTLGFIMVLHSTLLYHVGRGPFWEMYMGIDYKNCREHSWTTFLYINNWLNPSETCLKESWYLCVDTQAFLLILLLLYFTVNHPKRFWFILITAWILNHIYLAWHIYTTKTFHSLSPYPENLYRLAGLYDDSNDDWYNLTPQTTVNVAGSFIGTAIGFLAYKYENTQFLTSKTRLAIWWIVTYGGALGIIVFPGMWILSKSYYDSHWFSVPYLTLGTTIFSMCVCLGITGVAQGQGWVMKWVLEWPPVYYLGRISYSTYLAHASLIFYILGSKKYLSTTSEFSVLSDTIRILSLSLIFGLLLSLIIEYPTSALTSLLLKKKIKNEKEINEMKQKSS